MEVVTFRASSIQDALQMIRDQLGPDASILETREVARSGPSLLRQIEVAASNQIRIPSRFGTESFGNEASATNLVECVDTSHLARSYRQSLEESGVHGSSLVEQLASATNVLARSEGVTTK